MICDLALDRDLVYGLDEYKDVVHVSLGLLLGDDEAHLLDDFARTELTAVVEHLPLARLVLGDRVQKRRRGEAAPNVAQLEELEQRREARDAWEAVHSRGGRLLRSVRDLRGRGRHLAGKTAAVRG